LFFKAYFSFYTITYCPYLLSIFLKISPFQQVIHTFPSISYMDFTIWK